MPSRSDIQGEEEEEEEGPTEAEGYMGRRMMHRSSKLALDRSQEPIHCGAGEEGKTGQVTRQGGGERGGVGREGEVWCIGCMGRGCCIDVPGSQALKTSCYRCPAVFTMPVYNTGAELQVSGKLNGWMPKC